MSTMVNMLEAKSSLSKLVLALESGQASEFIIARAGRPAALGSTAAPCARSQPTDRCGERAVRGA